jgi:hypothetical protein
MEYIINSTRQENEVLITNVTITLDSDNIITCDISHFLPQNFNDINQGIINRAISEQFKINTIKSLENLINEIPTNQTIII